MSAGFHHLVEALNHFSLEFFKSHSLPAAGGNRKGGSEPTSGRCLSLSSLHQASLWQAGERGWRRDQDREGGRRHAMWEKSKRSRCSDGQSGRGGHRSRGHSDDMGVTSQGSRNGQRSLHCKKEQPSCAAAPRRTGLPHPRWASVPLT